MAKNITSTQLNQNLDHILQEVAQSKADIIIEKNGKATAALIPIALYQAWFARREKAFDILEKIGDDSRRLWEAEGKTETDMLEFVTEAFEEHRRPSKLSQ